VQYIQYSQWHLIKDNLEFWGVRFPPYLQSLNIVFKHTQNKQRKINKMQTKKLTFSVYVNRKLNISIKQLEDLCHPTSSDWIKNIEILDDVKNLGLNSVVYIENDDYSAGEDNRITLLNILEAIQKISSGQANVRKDLEYRIFTSYFNKSKNTLDAETNDVILQVASFGEVRYG
jgi:hypothetical protein